MSYKNKAVKIESVLKTQANWKNLWFYQKAVVLYQIIGISLCRMVDKMLMTYQKKKENEFIKEGGIKERMTTARLQYRKQQNQALEAANYEINILQKENIELRTKLSMLQKELKNLKK